MSDPREAKAHMSKKTRGPSTCIRLASESNGCARDDRVEIAPYENPKACSHAAAELPNSLRMYLSLQRSEQKCTANG